MAVLWHTKCWLALEIENIAWRRHLCDCSHATFWQKNAHNHHKTFPTMSFKHLRLHFVAHLSEFKIYYFCISWAKWYRIDGKANTQVVSGNVLLCMCCLIFSMRFYDWTKAIERIRCTYITSHCHKVINYSNKSTSGHLFVSQMMFWVIETEQNNKIIVIVRPKEMLNILNSKIVFSCFYKRIFPCNTQCRWLSTDFLGSSKSCQRSERMNNK